MKGKMKGKLYGVMFGVAVVCMLMSIIPMATSATHTDPRDKKEKHWNSTQHDIFWVEGSYKGFGLEFGWETTSSHGAIVGAGQVCEEYYYTEDGYQYEYPMSWTVPLEERTDNAYRTWKDDHKWSASQMELYDTELIETSTSYKLHSTIAFEVEHETRPWWSDSWNQEDYYSNTYDLNTYYLKPTDGGPV